MSDHFEEYHNHPRPELVHAFFRSPGLVLDVGCGGGATGKLIKEKWPDARVIGMDIDPDSLNRARQLLDAVVTSAKDPTLSDLSSAGIKTASIDTLILADILEHLENPWKFLRWIRPMLTHDAQVIVSLPNVRNLGVMRQVCAGDWPYADSGLLDITHLRFFTKKTAADMLQACGYEVLYTGLVPDVRLSHQGRPDHTVLINIQGGALHGVTPQAFDEWTALQHLFTARLSATADEMASDTLPSADEDRNCVQMQLQSTPTPEEIWRQNQALQAQEREWLLEARQSPSAPIFQVVLRQSVRNVQSAERAVQSLVKQIVTPNAVIVLQASTEIPILWPELPTAWSVVQGFPINDAIVALPNPEDAWVVFVDSGDFLAEDALARLGVSIAAHPQWRAVYSDEDLVDDHGRHSHPHCKPDFHLDTLRSLPYIGGLFAIRKDFLKAIGGLTSSFPGAEEYDAILRAAEVLSENAEPLIGHVARILYHRGHRSGSGEFSVNTIVDSGRAALLAHLQRTGERATVEYGPVPATYRVVYELEREPLVTILIPTKDQFGYLSQCVESVLAQTEWPNYEIVIIDNGSTAPDACNYLDALESNEEQMEGRLRVFRYPGPFDYTAMHNAAVEKMARGEVLLFLNNDTACLHPEWLRNMMRHALRPAIGAVGAKLLFPNEKIQHAGVIIGLSGGAADHPFLGADATERGYYGRLILTQNYEAVTAACMAVRKSLFLEVGGFDSQFPIQFNDVDLCLKLGANGYRTVWTPDAILMHHGSASQRAETEGSPEAVKKAQNVLSEGNDRMFRKWWNKMRRDTAYNANFTRHGRGFQHETVPALSWQDDWRPRPRVLAHPVNREGTGEYRIIAPARALACSGHLQSIESMQLLTPPEMAQLAPDSVIFQLQMEDHQSANIENWRRYSPDTLRVFEVDDLVIHLPMKNAHRPQMHKDLSTRLRAALKTMDRLVVTTEPLAQAYRGWIDDIHVVPNYLERARWGNLVSSPAGGGEKPFAGCKPRVGWVGGVSHQGDLELIADVVKATHQSIDWVFMGMCPDAMRPYVTFVPPVPLDQYPQKVASLGLDLAVAPLEMHPFNEGKSHLRLLEMGILGIPVVCTDIFPYQGGFPVLRVKNRYQSWLNAIQDAVADRPALAQSGQALKAHVEAHWMLEDHLDVWVEAWTVSRARTNSTSVT
ncbi:glycosyltransferase [Acidithiobacillus ferriphilus]|uniref:glycosyltransferase n=1 Tax=Acidithiobacillus ferriphilus TaxID=1689834 RepID=UPI001C064D2D|nr:glycosyltransferase [Acidithiobacillus ferriphilus]MBU2844710.1 glycosyltransferase [Acidithiobacillus ferriphilus]